MKTILSLMVLSLFSISVVAAPKRAPNRVDPDNDQRFLCKNDQSDLMYVVNVTDGEIDTFINDHQLANGIPTKVKETKNLHVSPPKPEIDPETRKKVISYVLSKRVYTQSRGEVLRPIAEIEIETGRDSSQVVVADMKIMDVKPSDDNDIDENLACKGTKKN